MIFLFNWLIFWFNMLMFQGPVTKAGKRPSFCWLRNWWSFQKQNCPKLNNCIYTPPEIQRRYQKWWLFVHLSFHCIGGVFFVHFITMDLYRYEFTEWCPLPAKAVGEGCVGIEPLFVRRWFAKCISFQTWLFWNSMSDFRGTTLVNGHSNGKIQQTKLCQITPRYRLT